MQSVIVETVSDCNLDCDYCYASPDFKDNEMGEETVRDILDAYSQFEEARMTWHGGEPLMKDADFFEKVIEIEDEKETDYKNVIQTNATLLSERKAEFLAENNFHVCSSLDGPKEMHNANRKFPNGEGTYEEVVEGIENLRRKDMDFTLVSVITRDKVGEEEELFNFFKGKTDRVEFNPVTSKDGGLTNEEFFQFYRDMYDLWVEDDSLDVGPIKEIAKSMFLGSNSLCTYTPDCSSNFLGIGHDGTVYPCGRFIGEGDFVIGDIEEDELSGLYDRKGEVLHPSEQDCEMFEICGCGCPYDNLKMTGSLDDPVYCDGREKLMEYIKNDLKERGYEEG